MKKNFSTGHCGEEPGDISKIIEYLSGALYWIALTIRDLVNKWIGK